MLDPNRCFPSSLSIPSLPKIWQFHLIFWYRNCTFKQNFGTRILDKTTIFYPVCTTSSQKIMTDSKNNYLQKKVTILFTVITSKKPPTQNAVESSFWITCKLLLYNPCKANHGIAASTDAITPQEHSIISSSSGITDDIHLGQGDIFQNKSLSSATIFVSLIVDGIEVIISISISILRSSQRGTIVRSIVFKMHL